MIRGECAADPSDQTPMASKACLVFLLVFCLGNRAHAQISQDQPELCGSVQAAQLPDGLSIVTTVGEGTSLLSIASLKSTIALPGIQDEVRQVCWLPGGANVSHWTVCWVNRKQKSPEAGAFLLPGFVDCQGLEVDATGDLNVTRVAAVILIKAPKISVAWNEIVAAVGVTI